MNKPKVSIICPAYNQEKFIRQTLDGFVMQKTNFPFEVLIHDDASTDGTADIIREYAEKYPDIIKPIFQTENQFQKGTLICRTFVYPRVTGEYVAVCDGDDFWTDEYKLQKQVDFLDAHPDYTVCFHPVTILYSDGHTEQMHKKAPKDLSLDKLLHENFIPNLSVMYRWHPNGLAVEQDVPKNIYPGDWFMHLLHAKHGKIGFLPDVMATYRRHAGGISFVSESGLDALHAKYGVRELNFYINAEKLVAPDASDYHKFVKKMAREILSAYIKANDFDSAITVLKMCPDLMDGYNDATNEKRWHHRFNKLLIGTILLLITTIFMGIVL